MLTEDGSEAGNPVKNNTQDGQNSPTNSKVDNNTRVITECYDQDDDTAMTEVIAMSNVVRINSRVSEIPIII